ncbi:MAG: hypothetical protein PHX14_05100, partial [Syntrophomonadaceae bacterium]|nr:hypothetical protein [Syntrophomonadaceae bacterium]
DIECTSEITSKQLSLMVGDNSSYIKVTAQDNSSTHCYTLTITRLSNDAAVSTVGTNYTVDNTSNTIEANQTIINTNVSVETFTANLSKQTQASWKVVVQGTPISNAGEFDAATAKASTATLIFGDQLAVKAGDGTIKVYAITVVLGDPVLGVSGSLGSYDSAVYKTPRAGFTWGRYRYWIFDSYQNMCWVGIIAYDQSNVAWSPAWQKANGSSRYHTGISLDTANRTIIITTEQGAGSITVPWDDVLITPQP